MSLRWEQIDLKVCPRPELRRDYPAAAYLFVTERGRRMTPATARKLVAREGKLAKLPLSRTWAPQSIV